MSVVARNTYAALLAVTVLATTSLVPACTPEDIVLAKLPPSSDAGPPKQGVKCADDSDCDALSFCSRISCADVGGQCESRPVVCDERAMPVCGCEGITYWNDCLRKAAGITSMSPGECTMNPELPPRKCGDPGGPPGGPGVPGGPEACPPGSFCARLLPPFSDSPDPQPLKCPPEVPGTCWALPAVCPRDSGPDRWLSCIQPKECVTTCDAIRTGEPYARAKTCH